MRPTRRLRSIALVAVTLTSASCALSAVDQADRHNVVADAGVLETADLDNGCFGVARAANESGLSIPPQVVCPTGSTGVRETPNPPVVERTLAALPSGEALGDDGPWKRFVDPSMLVLRLERTHDLAQERMAELLRDFSGSSFQDVDDWYGAVAEPSVPIAAAQIGGRWQCREMHINANGALSFPFEACNIRQTDICLEFDKTSGSTQMSGCLHRVDDTNFVFAQTGKFDRDNERLDGFLSASSESHLRLIVTHRYSMDIFELVRP